MWLLRFTLLYLVFAFTHAKNVGKSVKNAPKIINGTAAELGQFPWQVQVWYYDIIHVAVCSGAIISKEWVLTTADCLKYYNTNMARVIIYYNTVNIYDDVTKSAVIKECIVHENFDEKTFQNNVALMRFDPFEFNEYTTAINLAETESKQETDATVISWGMEMENATLNLQYVPVSTSDNKECEKMYGPDVVTLDTMCGKIDSEVSYCPFDSGAPLVVSNPDPVHVGMFSYVNLNGQTCAEKNPIVFTKTASFRDWIRGKTGV